MGKSGRSRWRGSPCLHQKEAEVAALNDEDLLGPLRHIRGIHGQHAGGADGSRNAASQPLGPKRGRPGRKRNGPGQKLGLIAQEGDRSVATVLVRGRTR